MLCFCRHCPCNCAAAEGKNICEPCGEDIHCSNGHHDDLDRINDEAEQIAIEQGH